MNKTITGSRYIDTGVSKSWYAKTALCICPNCQGPVLIRREFADEKWRNEVLTARANCLRCSFSKTWMPETCEWHGPVVGSARKRCMHCEQKWLTANVWKETYSLRMKQAATVKCGFCQESTELKLNWQRDWGSGKAIDPCFGLPLWLQINACANTLWAYNLEHLQTLKAYITATHRDRKGNWSMVTRLPQWMKSAKNREALLKGIAKLETKLENLNLL